VSCWGGSQCKQQVAALLSLVLWCLVFWVRLTMIWFQCGQMPLSNRERRYSAWVLWQYWWWVSRTIPRLVDFNYWDISLPHNMVSAFNYMANYIDFIYQVHKCWCSCHAIVLVKSSVNQGVHSRNSLCHLQIASLKNISLLKCLTVWPYFSIHPSVIIADAISAFN